MASRYSVPGSNVAGGANAKDFLDRPVALVVRTREFGEARGEEREHLEIDLVALDDPLLVVHERLRVWWQVWLSDYGQVGTVWVGRIVQPKAAVLLRALDEDEEEELAPVIDR